MRSTYGFAVLFAIGLFLGFDPRAANAATFHVNNSGSPACSDSGTAGTLARPWCTISFGLGRIASGDTLIVHAGTYNEQLFISGPAGTAASPTVIQANPGDTVTLVGNGNTGRQKIANTSYLKFIGFTITNIQQGLFVDSSNHITIQGITVHHVYQEGIHVHFDSSFVTIDGCTVHDTGLGTFNGEGIYIGTSNTSPLDNTNNVTVHGCTIHDTADEGIEVKPGTHDITVDGNELYRTAIGNNGTGGAAIEVNEAVGSFQHWDSNPNHVVKNNLVHNVGPGGSNQLLNSAIRAGTGGTYFNNVIWGINASGAGILANNNAGDSYTRRIYHNTVDVPSARAVVVSGATTDIKNNIGPAGANNLATSSAYFVNQASADYHLAAGSAPINAGTDLTSVVPTDIEGASRKTSPPPDLGAYEFGGASRPAPPTGLTVIVK